MVDLPVGTTWTLLVESAQNSASLAANSCPPEYGRLIAEHVQRLCDQSAPTTQAELDRRASEVSNLGGITSSISFAALRARQSPANASRVWEATQAFSESVSVDTYTAAKSMEFAMQLSML